MRQYKNVAIVNDIGDVLNPAHRVAYYRWCGIISRAYNVGFHIKRPTYIGCSVCDDWLTFSNFKRWHDENYRDGFHLDKDILVPGNKVYGPDTCCYVPPHVNTLLLGCDAARGNMPKGIRELSPKRLQSRINTTYLAQVFCGERGRLTKTFKTLSGAVGWYTETKRSYVTEVALHELACGNISQRVCDALIRSQNEDCPCVSSSNLL